VDFRSFKVGDNLAVTPGDVVMRHEMFELIQYAPQTNQVWHRPIFFVPSIINKYNAFDLAPGAACSNFSSRAGSPAHGEPRHAGAPHPENLGGFLERVGVLRASTSGTYSHSDP
jgi:Poly-beta-hydroxybutyrate polymerase (PhaC) N-terminus